MTSARKMALKYILKTEKALKRLKTMSSPVLIEVSLVKEVIEEAERYFKDAKYYLERKEYLISLASITYCEGLLDALRMLHLIKLDW